jgi:hypothetical protein
MPDKLILFELNEVPLRVVDEFCAKYPRSCLATLLPRCAQFASFAEDSGHLSPWITWPSLHRGVANDRHGIESFGQPLDEIDRAFPPLWDVLARQGVSTGVFGSLHSYTSFAPDRQQKYAFYVPDTFAAGSECFPERLSVFQELNLAMVRDSPRNVAARLPWRAALAMLAAAPGLGLKPATLIDAGRQLISERLQPARRVRRRTYQAILAFDVFFRQLRTHQPAFATFFTNHVASAMHRYWAARFPDDYREFGFDQSWVETYRGEIDFALHKLDRCLARLVRFVERRREHQLWIATSMGQAATIARPVRTQLFITDLACFLRELGVPEDAWRRRPAMAPDTNFVVDKPYEPICATALAELRLQGQPLDWRRAAGGFFTVRLGQADLAEKSDCLQRLGRALPLAECGLANVRIEDQSNTTAYHIPQGMLLVYDPRRAPAVRQRTEISTLEIAPAILRYFSASAPAYMQPSRIAA